MKILLYIFALLALAAVPVQAQCKDCGCKEQCTPKCRCERAETTR
ncbi:MAG: hypothetical protein ACO3XN_02190 [Chthoniobacterales bacterium]